MTSGRQVTKNRGSLLSYMITSSMASSNAKIRYRIDAPRLVHNEFSSLDSAMNI